MQEWVRNFRGFIGNRCLAEVEGWAQQQENVLGSFFSPHPSASPLIPAPLCKDHRIVTERGMGLALWSKGSWGCCDIGTEPVFISMCDVSLFTCDHDGWD